MGSCTAFARRYWASMFTLAAVLACTEVLGQNEGHWLHLANITKRTPNFAGSKDKLAFIFNDGGTTDKVHKTLESVADLKPGRGQLSSAQVNQLIGIYGGATNSYMRLATRGIDAWLPQLVLAFAVPTDLINPMASGPALPLAFEPDLTEWISANQEGTLDAKTSIPLRTIGTNPAMIRRMVLVVGTSPGAENTTQDLIRLRVARGSTVFVSAELPNTPQGGLRSSNHDVFFVPVSEAFSPSDFRSTANPMTVTLEILGGDMWRPSSLFLFGVDTVEGRPTAMTTLIQGGKSWIGLTKFSTDSAQGVRKAAIDTNFPFALASTE